MHLSGEGTGRRFAVVDLLAKDMNALITVANFE